MRRPLTLAVLLVLLVPGAAVGVTGARAASVDHPWLEQRVVNIAHSGGENEAPMSTLYAYRRAVGVGADLIELDVHSTADSELVVIHDSTVDRTTDGTGRVEDLTLAEVQELDAAHWFVPGRSAVPDLPEDSYPLRGARYGEVEVAGHAPEDFRVPALAEVFDAFPGTPMVIEIKGTADDDIDSYLRTGRLLAEFLNDSGRTDVIVASFKDHVIGDFHERAPRIGTAPGMRGTALYFLLGIRPPGHTVALHVPVCYEGVPMATRWFVQRAHRDGYAVHVWFSGTAPDDAQTYREVLRAGPDGLMPAEPSVLEEVLAEEGVERPLG